MIAVGKDALTSVRGGANSRMNPAGREPSLAGSKAVSKLLKLGEVTEVPLGNAEPQAVATRIRRLRSADR